MRPVRAAGAHSRRPDCDRAISEAHFRAAERRQTRTDRESVSSMCGFVQYFLNKINLNKMLRQIFKSKCKLFLVASVSTFVI